MLTQQQLVLYNATGFARYPLQCTDEAGIVVRNDGLPLRITTDRRRDSMLVYHDYGLMPEPYAHYLDGVRQQGVFLGLDGHTSWAFWNVSGPQNVPSWKFRLLINTEGITGGNKLREGEIGGYLVARGRA